MKKQRTTIIKGLLKSVFMLFFVNSLFAQTKLNVLVFSKKKEENLAYCNCNRASLNFPIISSISSFLQVPTLRRYQGDVFPAPKA